MTFNLSSKRKEVEYVYRKAFYKDYVHPDKILTIKKVLEIIKEQDKEFIKLKKITPEELHEWYLEATEKLNALSFNKEAQIPYEDLTEEQKFIDVYIADKVNEKSDKLSGEDLNG